MADIRQNISHSSIGGKTKQTVSGPDLTKVDQDIRSSDIAGGAQQEVDQEANELRLGKRYGASGRLAVIALAVVAVVALVTYLLPKVLH
jgi:hypothetical protein